jgi:hypothetical protein
MKSGFRRRLGEDHTPQSGGERRFTPIVVHRGVRECRCLVGYCLVQGAIQGRPSQERRSNSLAGRNVTNTPKQGLEEPGRRQGSPHRSCTRHGRRFHAGRRIRLHAGRPENSNSRQQTSANASVACSRGKDPGSEPQPEDRYKAFGARSLRSKIPLPTCVRSQDATKVETGDFLCQCRGITRIRLCSSRGGR